MACLENSIEFLLKRNLRKESPEKWLDHAKECGQSQTERPGKTIYGGTDTRVLTVDDEKEHHVSLVYVATERTILANGQILLTPEVEVDTYWTTLKVP